MKYFHRIAQGVDVGVLMHQLQRHPELWNADTFRTKFPGTPHVDVDDILLRFSDTAICDTTGKVMGDLSNVWHPAAQVLFAAKPIILDLMRRVEAYELGRVLITKLPPGGRILRHADREGEYVKTTDRARYHVVLQGLPGSLYTVADETVMMLTGEVWWFNAHEEHEVVNNSAEDRIHLLVDVRTWA